MKKLVMVLPLALILCFMVVLYQVLMISKKTGPLSGVYSTN